MTEQYTALVSPGHARYLGSIELILEVLVHVLEILTIRIGVVLAHPVVVAGVAVLGQQLRLAELALDREALVGLAVVPAVVDIVVDITAQVYAAATAAEYGVQRQLFILIAHHVL